MTPSDARGYVGGSESEADPAAELTAAYEDYQRAIERVEAIGEAELRRLQEAYEELAATMDEYEDRATGSGDFQAFVEFQGKIGTFTEELPEGLAHREVFEEIDETLQQRRLSESDFERVREMLRPVAEDVERLDERERAREAYRDARRGVRIRLDEIESEIERLERLVELGEADLDAPVEDLREPIEAYDEDVRAAFRDFKRTESARTVLSFVETVSNYPLVGYESPPRELRDYVEDNEVGAEPIPTLLEYADYSRSKLDHYVDDPAEIKTTVATRQTYLRRLDAKPLTIGWPPPSAGVARFTCRELESAVARLGEPDLLARLRTVRGLARESDRYERLRDSAVAREQLSDDERQRLKSGEIERDLRSIRERRDRLRELLDSHPDPD